MYDLSVSALLASSASGPLPPLSAGTPDYEQVAKHLPLAMYAIDREGKIVFFNEAAARLWGRHPTLAEEYWSGAWRLFNLDGSPLAHEECAIALTLKSGQPVRGVKMIVERPDGSRTLVTPNPELLFDETGLVSGAINLLIEVSNTAATERDAQHFTAIVNSSDDAIISKTLGGIIRTWNRGAEMLFGYTADEAVGQHISILIPKDRLDEETKIISSIRAGRRIAHYETIRCRKDGSCITISLSVSPIFDAGGNIVGASKIARDITRRKRVEDRLSVLNHVAEVLSADFDIERIVQVVTDIATKESGAKFGAFFYNITKASGESYLLYTLSGAPREAFEKFGMPRNTAVFGPTFKGTGPVRSENILKDPRYGKSAPHHGQPKGHLPVVSYLAVPVKSRSGEVIGGLFFGHDKPGVFTQDAEDLVVEIAKHAALTIDNARLYASAQAEIEERKKAEAAKDFLFRELKHRVKNTLATVQAIVGQSLPNASEEDRAKIAGRLSALAKAHDMLTRDDQGRIQIRDVIERALAPFDETRQARVKFDGPEILITNEKSLAVSLALHELATNAMKYGALSNDIGRVELVWRGMDAQNPKELRFYWEETGGPLVAAPSHHGFGTTLLKATFGKAMRIDYQPSGVICTLDLPL